MKATSCSATRVEESLLKRVVLDDVASTRWRAGDRANRRRRRRVSAYTPPPKGSSAFSMPPRRAMPRRSVRYLFEVFSARVEAPRRQEGPPRRASKRASPRRAPRRPRRPARPPARGRLLFDVGPFRDEVGRLLGRLLGAARRLALGRALFDGGRRGPGPQARAGALVALLGAVLDTGRVPSRPYLERSCPVLYETSSLGLLWTLFEET